MLDLLEALEMVGELSNCRCSSWLAYEGDLIILMGISVAVLRGEPAGEMMLDEADEELDNRAGGVFTGDAFKLLLAVSNRTISMLVIFSY